ncbi:hypothetical protein CH337_19625 [Rhodoblastus acidophilus]|nr:hypothetical protein CKO16_21480 [Rhodoblastus acidophilus]RAI16783.1 hypothetical protein CH337_19625 [Rhodoblastus acidophilus]
MDSRRRRNPSWKHFALIARDCRDDLIGIASLGAIGFNDLFGLINCNDEVQALEKNDADTVAQMLLAAPIAPLPGSLKNIFVTINPRTGTRKIQPAPAPRLYESMPFIF